MSKNKRIENKCEKNKNNEMAYIKAVPTCREASEPLFEEQSDAVKVSDTLCL